MATSHESITGSDFYQHEPVVHEVGIEDMSERFHELGEQVRAARHYEAVKAQAPEFGGNPELVTALTPQDATEVVKGAVADIQRQRALAEEMGPAPKREGEQQPHHPSHN